MKKKIDPFYTSKHFRKSIPKAIGPKPNIDFQNNLKKSMGERAGTKPDTY